VTNIMTNMAAIAAIKNKRATILDSIVVHRAITLAARDINWETTNDSLEAEHDELLSSIKALSKPTTAADPRTTGTGALRAEVPKLNSTNPAEDWHVYAASLQALAKQHGCEPNDADGCPVKVAFTDEKEAFLFSVLLQGMREAKMEYIVMRDNAKFSGTIAWRNLREHFDSSSRASLTMLLHKFLSSPHSRADMDLDKWLGNVMQQFERIINVKDVKLEDVLIAACVNHLPTSPEWSVFKNGLLNSPNLSKTDFYNSVSSFARNEECRASAQLQTTSTPTTTATTAIAMVAQQQQEQQQQQQQE
jgi:hypothetical protein